MASATGPAVASFAGHLERLAEDGVFGLVTTRLATASVGTGRHFLFLLGCVVMPSSRSIFEDSGWCCHTLGVVGMAVPISVHCRSCRSADLPMTCAVPANTRRTPPVINPVFPWGGNCLRLAVMHPDIVGGLVLALAWVMTPPPWRRVAAAALMAAYELTKRRIFKTTEIASLVAAESRTIWPRSVILTVHYRPDTGASGSNRPGWAQGRQIAVAAIDLPTLVIESKIVHHCPWRMGLTSRIPAPPAHRRKVGQSRRPCHRGQRALRQFLKEIG